MGQIAVKLSIIIATRNRAHAIGPCLDSVVAALAVAAPLDAEIVVVDNGSTDGTSEIVQAWAAGSSIPVQLLFEPKAGLSRAHNRALAAARGTLLAFTDDDCRLHSDYVIDLLRHDMNDNDLVLRGGRIELGDPFDLPVTINTSPKAARWSLAMNSARHECLPGQISGCNMTMRRALVERVGLFDEDFGSGSRIGSGGDSDYIIRAYLAGAVLEYVPDMTVFHHHGRKTTAVGHALMRSYMMANGALYVRYGLRHPDFCRPFWWDLKHAVREIITGTNSFMPCIGFSHRDKILASARGAVRYSLMRRS